jgi:hypothetical protein
LSSEVQPASARVARLSVASRISGLAMLGCTASSLKPTRFNGFKNKFNPCTDLL